MGKVCVITGATGGIGYHLVSGYQGAGYKVVGIDITEHRALPAGAELYIADISDSMAVSKVFEDVILKYGGVDVLINNGAISKFSKDVTEITPEEFARVINVNLCGSFYTAQQFIKANEGREFGRIINFSSTRWLQNEAG